MAITFDLEKQEFARIDPDDPRGPITVRLPAVGTGDNSEWVGLNVKAFGAAVVTIEAQGTTTIDDPAIEGGAAPTIEGAVLAVSAVFVYDETNDVWFIETSKNQQDQRVFLQGAPSNFSPGASFTPIENWPTAAKTPLFESADPVGGILKAPRADLYRVKAQTIFQQGNTNKELAILLWARFSLLGDLILDSLQVSDDKTDWRSLGSSNFIIPMSAGETVQLGLSRVNQSIGTASFQPCSFELELIQGTLRAV